MDPLSDVLSLLKLRSFMSGGLEAGGDWSLRFGPHDGIKFYAVVTGQCWLVVEGVAAPVRVAAGDCFLLPHGRPFRIGSDPALTPIDAIAILPTGRPGGVVTHNGGGDFFSVGGYFTLAGDHAGTLLGMLPPIVHVRPDAEKAVLRWCLDRMRQELREPQPGGLLVAQQLASMILVQTLRLHLADRERDGIGWLYALADRRMAAAMAAMHEDPARHWTLHALAARAGMSRTTFALAFRAAVGTSPMDYLTRWRMMVAADRLTAPGASIAAIARALGYQSESAFSTAFKRVMGGSPRRYARGRSDAPPHGEAGPAHGRVGASN